MGQRGGRPCRIERDDSEGRCSGVRRGLGCPTMPAHITTEGSWWELALCAVGQGAGTMRAVARKLVMWLFRQAGTRDEDYGMHNLVYIGEGVARCGGRYMHVRAVSSSSELFRVR